MTGPATIPARLTERERDRRRVAARRALARDLVIPPIANPRRRRLAGDDPRLFLEVYFPDTFYREFSENHVAMIDAFRSCIDLAGYQAVAAPRGEGKSEIARGLALWALLYGHRRFVVLIGANAGDAIRNTGNIRDQVETNDRLAADFPEACHPVRALGGAAQRANQQTVAGVRTRTRWTGDILRFPMVIDPATGRPWPAAGALITCRGLDAAIRGLNYNGQRPDMVIIDDPQTRETAASATEIAKRERYIDADVAQLGGQDTPIAILLLATIIARNDLADIYTDPARKPAWGGHRHKLLTAEPDRADLWDTYVDLRQRDAIAGDKTGRTAHRHLLAHREAMHAGAIVSNPARYFGDRLPDGTRRQISALQFCYDVIADDGRAAFETEYQNVPPADEAPETAGIDLGAVMTATDGLARGTVPPATDVITAAVDVHGRHLAWTVLAVAAGAGYVVDYGSTRVHSPLEGALTDPANARALDEAIVEALAEVRDQFAAGWPESTTGEVRHLDLCLVDAGYRPQAVYAFCRTGPRGLYVPSKGFGTATGQARYRPPAKKARGRRLGRNWFSTRQAEARIWLMNLNADHWKETVHAAFLLPRDDGTPRPGSLSVFGSDPIAHREYADQVTAEALTTIFRGGRELTFWDRRRRANHYLDTTAMARAAAAIRGIPEIPAAAARPAGPSAAGAAANRPPTKKPKMSERQKARRSRR